MHPYLRIFLVLAAINGGSLALVAKGAVSPRVESILTIKEVEYPVFSYSELKPLRRVKPYYPYDERENGTPGNVVVLVLVDREGKPAEVMLKRSEPSPVFGKEAVLAVKQWRFPPALWRGEPTEYILQVPIVFRVR